MLDLMTRLPVSLHDNIYDDFHYLQSLAPCAPFKVSTDMTILNFPMVTLGCCPGFRQTVSYKLQTKCQATQALLHVIGLVDWPKHVKSFFFFFCRGALSTLEGSVLDLSPDSTKTCSFCKDSRVVNAKNIRLQHSVPDDDQGGISDGMAIPKIQQQTCFYAVLSFPTGLSHCWIVTN